MSIEKRPVSADVKKLAALHSHVPVTSTTIPRRASKYRQGARCQVQTEDDPGLAYAPPASPIPPSPRRISRRTALLFCVGLGAGAVLIRTGLWVQDILTNSITQWHDGDAGVTQLDANVGHGGTSRFLACYYHGSIIVIEFAYNSDPAHEHTYTIPVGTVGDTTPRTVSLSVDPQKNLAVQINGTPFSYLLQNTGDQFQVTAHPQQEGV